MPPTRRMWAFPEGLELYVQELRSQKKDDWPRSIDEAKLPTAPKDGAVDRRWNRRRIHGAKHFLVNPGSRGRLAASGVVDLADGTQVEWYLWDGERPAVQSYAHINGYIAALYMDELYDTQQHFSQFRSFGITQKQVRTNLTLIAVPPTAGKATYGVYPDTARNGLKIQGTKRAGEPLPWAEWAEEFAAKLPEPIATAIAKAGPADSAGSIGDSKWKERLIDRFGRRWNTVRYILSTMGLHKVHPSPTTTGDGGAGGRGSGGSGGSGGAGPAPGGDGQPKTGVRKAKPGPEKARSVKRRGGVPDWRWTNESEVEEGHAAAWSPHDPQHENGVVLLNRQFPPFVELKQFWKEQYPDHQAEEAEKVIEEVYGEVMVARIAHSEELRSDPRWGTKRVEDELRTPAALTMAALGLLSEDQLIARRLAGRLGKAKPTKLGVAA